MIGTLRGRVLELTLQLERSVPGAGEIEAGKTGEPVGTERAETVTHITNQIINGGVVGPNVANSGDGATFDVTP
jgi:hypothetical protein